MSKKGIIFLVAESSIHTGSGEDVGYVDQPIQREKFSDFPIIQASEIKGALRDYFEDQGKDVQIIFGPESGGDFASAVSFGEAKLLFLPVKSLYGVYAYVTCPYLLNRFLKEANLGISFNDLDDNSGVVLHDSLVARNNKVILHEFPFTVINNYQLPRVNNNDLFEWLKDRLYPADVSYKYWKDNLAKRVVVISNSNMKVFSQIAVEIVTRNRIGEEGTASSKGGNLWIEENLPEETIMYFTFEAFKPRFKPSGREGNTEAEEQINSEDKVHDFIKDGIDSKVIQLGGNKTIGRGFILLEYLNMTP